MKLVLFFILLCFSSTVNAQYDSDAILMKSMTYMKYAGNADCNKLNGNNLEHRICLNLEFQEVDSILNYRFHLYLISITEASLKQSVIDSHNAWIIDRRSKSEKASEGWQSNMLGITYLTEMIEITNRKIEELTQ